MDARWRSMAEQWVQFPRPQPISKGATVRFLGKDIGYDDPFWYFGAWEFLLHDTGWLLTHRQIIRLEGRWPSYKTIHR